MKNKLFPAFFIFCLFAASGIGYTAVKKDIQSWTKRDPQGHVVLVSQDRNGDGKPDAWIYYRDGAVYKREWDRNFDGKADLRILEDHGRYVSKEYDNNFDGKFETRESAPVKGSSGKAKYLANEINASR